MRQKYYDILCALWLTDMTPPNSPIYLKFTFTSALFIAGILSQLGLSLMVIYLPPGTAWEKSPLKQVQKQG